jgi:hypothetical protein
MNEDIQRSIHLLEEEANTEHAFFSLEYSKKSINQTEIVANKDGLRLYIAELFKALNQEEIKAYPIKQQDWYMNNFGISPQYIKLKDKSRKSYQKSGKNKTNFLAKASPYIMILLIAAIVLFLISVIVNNWI